MSSFDLSKPIAIGADHAGFEYKRDLIVWLKEKGYQVSDKGTFDNSSVDYPDYAHPVAEMVEKGRRSSIWNINVWFCQRSLYDRQ